MDALLILFSFWLVKDVWVTFIRPELSFPNELILISFPAFTLIYLTAAYYAGLYDRIYRAKNLVRSTAIAMLSLLAIVSFVNEG